MPRHGCSADGHLDEAEFSTPMPWIGVYIAAASAACLLAMASDLLIGFRRRQFWFPCRFFSINATTLTVMAVVVKLSLDLNTAMPSRLDQLAKLSSSVLTCTAMANSMPSLGTMPSSEDLLMNLMALAILVITLLVNVCIQLGTGAIFVLWIEHSLVMLIMILLLLLLSFSAITVPTTKRFFDYKYNAKYNLALRDQPPSLNNSIHMVSKLRQDMTKYWVMAHTCSPQFVMGRSVTCTASGALCLVSAAILAEALSRSFFMPWSLRFCSGNSDYEWSTTLVLVVQTVAVAAGTVAPALRWLLAIRFKCPYRGNKKMARKEFQVEKYWIQGLQEMKDCPLTSPIFKLRSRHLRRLAHDAKNRALDMCIATQIGIVFASKLIRFVSIYSVSKVLFFCDMCGSLKRKVSFRSNSNMVGSDDLATEPDPKVELSRFVLHLEGEEALVDLMIKHNCDATTHWFHHGKKKQPADLIKLLEKSSRGFRGLGVFDSDRVPSLDLQDPPNSWTLTVVTLASIALALPNIEPCSIKYFRDAVSEGLFYLKNMEKYLDTRADLSNIRRAAQVTWTEVDLYHRWLDVDLRVMSTDQEKTPWKVIEELSQTARNKFYEYKSAHMIGCSMDDPLNWHAKVLAANSMYRIGRSLALHLQHTNSVFDAISDVISDILCACMTNLHQVISIKCLNSSIEDREETVRQAVFVLGKTEEILKILERREIPSFDSKQMGCIDAWRLSIKSSSETDDGDVRIAVVE